MARYLKLGASRNTDRDTSLFQTIPDLPHEGDDSRAESGKHGSIKLQWSILRRAHSTRERIEDVFPPPRRSVTLSSKLSDGEQLAPEDDKFDVNGYLRRVRSTKDHPGTEKVSEKLKKQQQQPVSLVRAQSLRYNRIVSADEEWESEVDQSDRTVVPPRHSCMERMSLEEEFEEEGKVKKRMVRVSASYQTREGEILSIECSQCGRWLGTVGRRVNLEGGFVKLCQICHPATEHGGDEPFKAAAAAAADGVCAGAAVAGGSRAELKRGGFFRGLRKMLGLKKTSR